MSKKMAYELVEAADAETLSSMVTKKLAQGWKLVGSACVNDSEGVVHRGWMDFGGVFESIFSENSQVHTGCMGQGIAEKWAKQHPKGATDSMHYTLLGPLPGSRPHSQSWKTHPEKQRRLIKQQRLRELAMFSGDPDLLSRTPARRLGLLGHSVPRPFSQRTGWRLTALSEESLFFDDKVSSGRDCEAVGAECPLFFLSNLCEPWRSPREKMPFCPRAGGWPCDRRVRSERIFRVFSSRGHLVEKPCDLLGDRDRRGPNANFQ